MPDSLVPPWAPSFFASFVCAPADRDGDETSRWRATKSVSERASEVRGATAPLRPIGGVAVPDLLGQLRAGQREALSTLYKALFEELWRIALLQTRSQETANEIVQDVFLWLWARREAIRQDTDIRVYLAAAIRNRARTLGRHARVVDAAVAAAESTEVSAVSSPAMGQPMLPADVMVEEHEFRAAYHRAIGTLTDQERLAVFLRWEEEWTFEQIGQAMAISKVGARKVVLRAQQKVRVLLEQYRG